MTTTELPSRRQVLLGAGAGAGLVVLSACSSGGSSSGGGGSATAPAPLVPSGTELADVSAVPVGGALSVTIDDAPILVTQPTGGEFHAFDAICTHQGCPVGVGEGELECPCHGSRYDLTTAEVLGGPAERPLPELDVVVQDDKIVVA